MRTFGVKTGYWMTLFSLILYIRATPNVIPTDTPTKVGELTT